MGTKTETIFGRFVLLASVILWPIYLLLLVLYLYSLKKGVQKFFFKFGLLEISFVSGKRQSKLETDLVEADVGQDIQRPSMQEIEKLIKHHNRNLARFLETRDTDCLQETIASSYLNLSESYFEMIFDSMEQSKWTTCHLVTLYLTDKPVFVTDNRLAVTTNETWEYFYTNGQRPQACSVNKYTIVREKHKWLVEACDLIADHSHFTGIGRLTSP